MKRALEVVVLPLVLCGIARAQSGVDPALLARASGGDAAAQVQVGEQYAHAAASEQDPDVREDDWNQVLAWYRKAADQNSVAGELHLAMLYRDGGGKTITRDMTQAAEWYRKAAEQGDTGAQGTLGMLYFVGQGVAHSDSDAYFWLDLAASAPGANQAQYVANRQNVGQHLSTDDLDAIHERERQWKKAHAAKQ